MNALLSYGQRHALNELLAMFDGQWANGLLPHVRYVPDQSGYRPDPGDWGISPAASGLSAMETSGITQPPIMGTCAEMVFRRLPDPQAHLDDWLAIADGLERFHHFLLTERDPTGEGLVVCLHPWETGTDNSPAFEPLLGATRAYLAEKAVVIDAFGRADMVHVAVEHRPTAKDYTAYFGLIAIFKQHDYDQRRIAAATPFLLQDVLFNALLVDALYATARLEESLASLLTSQNSGRADALRQRANANTAAARRVADSIRRLLWSEADGIFYARDARRGELIPVATVSSFMPLLADIADARQATRLLAHLQDPAEFWTPFPVPSTAATDPAFDPLRYWTGPSWPVPNWLLHRALRSLAPDLSRRLRDSTLRMIAESDDDPARWWERATQVMAYNSVGGRTTTPSRQQYQHAWLWDSAVAAVGWTYTDEEPGPFDPTGPGPLFWEYYHPYTGAPLGARLMTWTAAVFLDLLAEDRSQ
ncbi:MAG: trehalase family glycosidase [Anaerolineae bacterium]